MRSPKAFLDKTALSRPTRKQARPLRTTEVVYLEEFLKDAGNDVRDRYAAGVFLFALYAISRWSDLKVVQNFFLDVDIVDGKSVGFVEFRTFSHKTASQVAKHGLSYAISGANLGPDRSAMGHKLGRLWPTKQIFLLEISVKDHYYQRPRSWECGACAAPAALKPQSGC